MCNKIIIFFLTQILFALTVDAQHTSIIQANRSHFEPLQIVESDPYLFPVTSKIVVNPPGAISGSLLSRLTQSNFIHDSGISSKDFHYLSRHVQIQIMRTDWQLVSPIGLSTSELAFFDGMLDGFSFRLKYRIFNFNGYAWYKGSYSNAIQLRSPVDGTSGKSVFKPAGISDHALRINIPLYAEIIDAGAMHEWFLFLNGVGMFETGLNATGSIYGRLLHTTPVRMKVRSLESTFTAVTAENESIDVDIPSEALTYKMGGNQITVNTTDQTVYDINTIPNGNKTILPDVEVSISAENLKKYFFRAGIYTLEFNSSFCDKDNNDALVSQYRHKIIINVSNFGSFTVKNNIELGITSVDDFLKGVFRDYSDHLELTQMAPFKISVKANSSTFSPERLSQSAVIPMSILQIGPSTTQDPNGFNTVQLSTSYQDLISGEPAIGKKYSIKYTIPSVESKKILDTSPVNVTVGGNYKGTITFSLTPQ